MRILVNSTVLSKFQTACEKI